jgi:hypothetical protein
LKVLPSGPKLGLGLRRAEVPAPHVNPDEGFADQGRARELGARDPQQLREEHIVVLAHDIEPVVLVKHDELWDAGGGAVPRFARARFAKPLGESEAKHAGNSVDVSLAVEEAVVAPLVRFPTQIGANAKLKPLWGQHLDLALPAPHDAACPRTEHVAEPGAHHDRVAVHLVPQPRALKQNSRCRSARPRHAGAQF